MKYLILNSGFLVAKQTTLKVILIKKDLPQLSVIIINYYLYDLCTLINNCYT